MRLLKEIFQSINEELILEAIANDDKGKLFEILHAKHMHPKKELPIHYRDEDGKSPKEVHDSIREKISKAEYNTVDKHAAASADVMRSHLTKKGIDHNHISRIAWTSKGASDVKNFTGTEDPHNDSDVMYEFKHPKTRKIFYAGAGLKYGSQKLPNIRNPGLESLEKITGATTLVKHFSAHKNKIAKLGYKDSAKNNHEKWKTEKNSVRGRAAEQSKLETTRSMAKDIHKALSKKESSQLKDYVKNIVSPKTKHPTFRLHTQTSHNEAGSKATHHIDEPSKDVDTHLNNFTHFFMDKTHSGGISVVIKGQRKDGKISNVLQHAIKGVSGPMKGLAASTKLPGYRTKNKSNIKEEAPANSMGAGPQGLDSAKGAPIAGYDKLLMGRKMLRRKALDVLGRKK